MKTVLAVDYSSNIGSDLGGQVVRLRDDLIIWHAISRHNYYSIEKKTPTHPL